MKTQYSSSSRGSSISCQDERSSPSSDSSEENRERGTSPGKARPSYLTLRLDESFSKRKISTSSEASSIGSANQSLDGAYDAERNSHSFQNGYNDVPLGTNKFDDIIDKLVGLRFSQSNFSSGTQARDRSSSRIDKGFGPSTDDVSNANDEEIVEEGRNIDQELVENDLNGNYDSDGKKEDEEYWDDVRTDDDDVGNDDDDDDDDLVERGPVRPPGSQSRHSKPYYTLDWLAATSDSATQNQSYTSDYDSTAERILRNKQFSEKINPCLDKLSDYGQSNRSYYDIAEQPTYGNLNSNNGWASPDASYTETGTSNSNTSGEDVSIVFHGRSTENQTQSQLNEITDRQYPRYHSQTQVNK